MKWPASLATVAASIALAAAACSVDETVAPIQEPPSGARALGMFSSEIAADPTEQAYRALAEDAWYREHRFLDAAKPGHLFESTRATPSELASGARSPDEIFQIGAQLFHHRFTPREGFGAKDLPPTSRFHTGRRGGPDAERCASCHWRGGIAGAGDGADNAYFDGDGRTQSTTLVRNPISLAGAGLLEIAAREMTAELRQRLLDGLGRAIATTAPVTVDLLTKGTSYGTVIVHPTGAIDRSGIDGIEPDLVVRPFGWKGTFSNLRDAVEDALLLHHGMQSTHLARTAPPLRVGPFGGDDPDGDGVAAEITEGQVSALTMFVAMQEVPQIQPTPHPLVPSATWPAGQMLFQQIGCASCHTPSLPLDSTVYALAGREGDPDLIMDLAEAGAMPRIERSLETGAYRLHVFSDLKRHDMGPDLADARDDGGAGARLFLTRPLWGVVRSGPYMHDGRAPTLRDAILLHGGEAQASRDAYAALTVEDQGAVDVYLASLTRAPRITRLP